MANYKYTVRDSSGNAQSGVLASESLEAAEPSPLSTVFGSWLATREASAEGDAHDLGLRIVSALFELDGWRTLCLGANTRLGTPYLGVTWNPDESEQGKKKERKTSHEQDFAENRSACPPEFR